MVFLQKDTVEYYDSIAPYYDATFDMSFGNRNIFFNTLNSVDLLENNKKLLDVGSGTGIMSEMFLQKSLEVYGLDASPNMVDIFKKKGFKDAMQIDICKEKFPFENNFFDYVISNAFFCLIPNLSNAIEEISRVIKGDSIFCFSVEDIYNRRPKAYLRSGVKIFYHNYICLENLLNKYEFKILKMKNYVDYIDMFGGKEIIFTLFVCQKNTQ